MRKTKLQELTSTALGQIEVFCRMCHFAKTNGAFGGNGITKEDLLAKGVSSEVFEWLVKNHYCNEQKAGRPLWVAINGNKFYPNRTVQNLEKALKEFRDEQLQRNSTAKDTEQVP